MSVVIDASITLPWYFQDEVTPGTEAVLNRVIAEGAVAPAHWKLEVANGFRTALLRQRIDRAYRDESLQDLSKLAIEIDTLSIRQAWTTTLVLADRSQSTPYGAAYLEPAMRRNLPLATLDKELLDAIKLVGLERA